MTFHGNLGSLILLQIFAVGNIAFASNLTGIDFYVSPLELFDKCHPEVYCEASQLGDKVPDPLSCYNFYLCIEGPTDIIPIGNVIPSDVPLACPNRQYFDVISQTCKFETYPCGNTCLNRECAVDCKLVEDTQYIANSKYCGNYFVCIDGKPNPLSCQAPRSYFNGQHCVENEEECCSLCAPYCEKANTEVLDPFDCERYYACLHASSIPDESYHYRCDDDQYFDYTKGHCVQYSLTEEQCKPRCNSNLK